MVLRAEKQQRLAHFFHSIGRIAQDTGTQEQPFDIISFVKFNGQFTNLLRCKSGALYIIAGSVDTIFAIIGTMICHQDLEKGDTSSVCSKTMTDAACFCIAELSFLSPAAGTA